MENLTCIYSNKDLMGVVNNIIRMKKNNNHPYFDFIEGFEYLTAQGYKFSNEVIDKIADLRVFVAGEKITMKKL